ncbi:hypothetical protein ALC56_13676 [Trachymyrmex septentrionalis]|uniref:Uncharacterized protein n=1 Tax=Trachymyrmex septentrionalis TaxID=34720 RepID=A0A195EUK0_9HYME|nr:hypothetical protein ALC56_13676 [Trachymyrmex septentrionalis]
MTKSNERPQKSNGLYQCVAECIEVSRRSKEHATEKKGRVSQFKLSLEIVVDPLVGRGLVTVRNPRCSPLIRWSRQVDAHDGFYPRGRNLSIQARSISMHVALHRTGRAVQ